MIKKSVLINSLIKVFSNPLLLPLIASFVFIFYLNTKITRLENQLAELEKLILLEETKGLNVHPDEELHSSSSLPPDEYTRPKP